MNFELSLIFGSLGRRFAPSAWTTDDRDAATEPGDFVVACPATALVVAGCCEGFE